MGLFEIGTHPKDFLMNSKHLSYFDSLLEYPLYSRTPVSFNLNQPEKILMIIFGFRALKKFAWILWNRESMQKELHIANYESTINYYTFWEGKFDLIGEVCPYLLFDPNCYFII